MPLDLNTKYEHSESISIHCVKSWDVLRRGKNIAMCQTIFLSKYLWFIFGVYRLVHSAKKGGLDADKVLNPRS